MTFQPGAEKGLQQFSHLRALRDAEQGQVMAVEEGAGVAPFADVALNALPDGFPSGQGANNLKRSYIQGSQ